MKKALEESFRKFQQSQGPAIPNPVPPPPMGTNLRSHAFTDSSGAPGCVIVYPVERDGAYDWQVVYRGVPGEESTIFDEMRELILAAKALKTAMRNYDDQIGALARRLRRSTAEVETLLALT